jgi:hypothetical protein
MKSSGQLVHIEEFRRDGVLYRVTVHKDRNKLHGTWCCEACSVCGEENSTTHRTALDCVAHTKGFVDSHHRENHACSTSGRGAKLRSAK